MRPRLGSAIADIAARTTADPSRWTHRVGVTDPARRKITPTRNAIGLSRPMVFIRTVADGRLSPWRCATGMMGNNSIRHDG
jgi:hypothetical protein